MNCEKCQELLSDFIDGSLSHEDQASLNFHLEECLGCFEVRNDLHSIVSFCQVERGNYAPVPNEQALWLRIRNVVEVGNAVPATPASRKPSWMQWLSRSWELSFPQLAASVAALVLVVSLSTAVGLRRWQSEGAGTAESGAPVSSEIEVTNVLGRMRQQQQMIEYWNHRVEVNKARWSPQMRETFDRNLAVIDQAVSDSLRDLQKNPHDEVSEEMLNAALNEKLSILKEFADL
jgi:hypothetical protein